MVTVVSCWGAKHVCDDFETDGLKHRFLGTFQSQNIKNTLKRVQSCKKYSNTRPYLPKFLSSA
jgi:hypothetical protein